MIDLVETIHADWEAETGKQLRHHCEVRFRRLVRWRRAIFCSRERWQRPEESMQEQDCLVCDEGKGLWKPTTNNIRVGNCRHVHNHML
jgi:hypothetical protein